MLDPLKESSFKLMALYEEEAGVDNDQDTVSGTYLRDTVPFEEFEATDWWSLRSPDVGSAAVTRREAREPESENQFEEAGRQYPDTATKRTHWLSSPRLTFEKIKLEEGACFEELIMAR